MALTLDDYSFDEYQDFAGTTWTPTDWAGENSSAIDLAICGLGAAGEASECAEKIKKILHYKNGVISTEDSTELAKEIGDVLWYLANLCSQLGLSFGAVAELNKVKLQDRAARGTLKGSGDNR